MELILFVLVLIVCAILFPEGTRAFVMFVFKTATVVAIIGAVLFVIILAVGSMKAHSVESVQKISTPRVYHSARVITLHDGTKVNVEAGWFDE